MAKLEWLENVSFEGVTEKQKQAVINYYSAEGQIFYAFSPESVIDSLRATNKMDDRVAAVKREQKLLKLLEPHTP